MSVNRYTTPTRVVQRPQPFLLPAEQMFKVLAQRQEQYDALTSALSGLDQGWAGQTARYQRDQNYLTKKRQEVNDFITSLEGQDLTRVPNLKGKILAVASDPTLSIIKQNNEYYDARKAVVDKQRQDNTYSPANDYMSTAAIEEYEAKDAAPEFFAAQSPNSYWKWGEHAEKLGEYLKPYVEQNIFTDPETGLIGVKENSGIKLKDAYEKILGGLDDNDVRQLLSEYRYAIQDRSVNESDPGFQQYLMQNVLQKANVFTYEEIKISQLRELSDTAKAKANNPGPGLNDGFILFGGGKAQGVTYTGGFNINTPIQPQAKERIKNLDEAIKANEQLIAQYKAAPNSETTTVNIFAYNDKTKKWEFHEEEVPVAYVSANDPKDLTLHGEDVINLINEQQAMKQQKYYYEKNLAQAEEEAYHTAYAQLMSEGRREEARQLRISKYHQGDLGDMTGFASEINSEIQAELLGPDWKNPNYFYELTSEGVMRVDRKNGQKELAFSKHSNQYKELVSNATEEVQKKNYGLVTYNKILQDNLKKEYGIKTMFMKGLNFSPEDKDYQSLESAIDINPDGFFFYDDATGEQYDQFGKNVLSKNNVGFVPRVFYYNPWLKQWMVQGGVVPLDEKGNKLIGKFAKGDLANRTFSVAIESLDRELLQQLYGDDNAKSVEIDAKRELISEAFKNSDDGAIHIPISAGGEGATLYATQGENGTIYGSYYDPIAKKYITFSDKDINDFSNRLVQYNILQNEFNAQIKAQNQAIVQESLKYQFNKLGYDQSTSDAMIAEVMYLVGRESGFNASKRNNADGKAGGLFQFYPDKGSKTQKTINGKVYQIADIAAKSPEEQVALWVNEFIGKNMPKVAEWQQKYGYGAFALYNLAPRIILNDYSPETPLHKVLEGTKEDVVEWVKDNPQYMGLTPVGLRQLEANGKLIDYAYSVTVDDIRKNILNK